MIAELALDARVLDQILTTRRGPFLVCGRSGSILYIDPVAREALRIKAAAGRPPALRDLQSELSIVPDVERAVAGIFEQAALGRCADETQMGSEYVLRPLQDSADSVIGVIVELVGDRFATTSEVASNGDGERYQRLIEASSQGIIVHRNSRVLYANQAAASVLGYATPDELRRLASIDDYVHPDDRVSTQAYRASRGRGEWAPDDYEFRAIRKDGTIVWINCRPTVIDWDGKPAFQVTFFDVTERRRAQEGMARADARFRELLEQAALGILIRRGETTVFANQAIATIFGYHNRQDILDVGIIELAKAEHDQNIRPTAAADGPVPGSRYFEFSARRQGGATVWLGCWNQPVSWDDETASLSILVDITERKRLEEKLREAHRTGASGRMPLPTP
jgi:PAS domain S-box-containing protein